jgi:hypothetical protein
MATTPNLITRATRKQALEERGLIRAQMRLGAGLIALGALSIPLFQVSGVLELRRREITPRIVAAAWIQPTARPPPLEGRAVAGLAAGQLALDGPLRASRRYPNRVAAAGCALLCAQRLDPLEES